MNMPENTTGVKTVVLSPAKHRVAFAHLQQRRRERRKNEPVQDTITLPFEDVHPVHEAIANDRFDEVRHFLNRGGNVETTNGGGETLLFVAAGYGGSAEMCQLLLDAGANPQTKNCNRLTPFHAAVRYGKAEVVRLFIEQGADINELDPSRCSMLRAAVRYLHYDTILLFLEYGAGTDEEEPGDFTLPPLLEHVWQLDHISQEHVDIAELLICFGADTTVCSNLGETALDLTKDPRMVAMLRHYGVEANYDGCELKSVPWDIGTIQK